MALPLHPGGAVAVGGVESSWEQGEKGRGRLLGEGWAPEIRTESKALCVSTSAPALSLICLSFNAFCLALGFFFLICFSSNKDKTEKVSIESISGHCKTMWKRSIEQESEEQREKKNIKDEES